MAAFIGGTIVLMAALIASAPFLINTPFVKERLVGFVQEKTGVSIPAQGLSFDLSMVGRQPCLVTQFHDMELALSSGISTYIGGLQAQWGLRELLQGQPVCLEIQVQDVSISTLSMKFTGPFNNGLPLEWDTVFSYFPEYQERVDLVFHNVSSPFFSSASGVFSLYKADRSVTGKSHIQNLLIKKDQISGNNFFLKALPFETFKAGNCDLGLQAQLSGNTMSLETVLKNVSMDSSRLDHPVRTLSDLRLVVSREPGKFHVRMPPVQWAFPKSILGYSWTYDGSKTPAWNMVFSGQKINVDEVADVCLSLAGENALVRNLFTILPGGQADQVQAAFSANTLQDMFDPHDMNFSARMDNARVHIPNTPLELDQVQGKVVMEKGKLLLGVNSGVLGNSRIGPSDCIINLLDSGGFPFQGRFDLDADIAHLPEIFLTLQPDGILAREMKRIRSSTGRAQGLLFVKYQPGMPLDIRGNVKHISGSIDYEPLGAPLTIHEGSLLYSREKICFDHVFADMGQHRLKDVSGQAALSSPHVMEISSGTALLDAGGLITLLQKFSLLPPDMSMPAKGNVHLAKIFLKGPVQKPGQWAYQIQGPFDLDADIAKLSRIVTALQPDGILAREMKRIRSATGRAQGFLFVNYQPGMPLDIRGDVKHISGSIDYEPLGAPLTIHEGSLLYSREKICFDHVFADMEQHRLKDVSGQVALSSPHVMEISSGTALLDAGGLITLLQKFSLLPPDMSMAVKGNVHLEKIFLKGPFQKPGQWKYQIAGKARDVHWQWTSQTERPFAMPGGPPLSGRFVLTQDQVQWEDERGNQANGRGKKTSPGVQLRLDHFGLCDFLAKGDLFFSSGPQGTAIDASVHIQSREQATTSSLFACFLKDGSMVEGPCSLSCELEYKGAVKDFQKNLQGEFAFSALNGTIHRATFLARVLSVVNIITIPDIMKKGIDYHSIKIRGTMKNGLIRLTNAVIDADNMVLFFTGWIDPFGDKLDLTCLVAPLKTMDTIIQQIPLVNVIIGRKLVSIPVSIQGSLKDPDIMALHPSEVGNSLVRLFEHIITTPAKLLDMKTKEPVSEP